ncbi:MAG TPA: molybdopterin-dependent oxidoreductase [Actinomycetota bacterium]
MVRPHRPDRHRLRALLAAPLRPPDVLRVGPFREGAFRSHLHSQRTAAWLGIGLGISFGLCFATGLLSHAIQHPPSWFDWPPRPAGLYRVTQGLHVATGIASVPLLLAKLWVVYPRLWTWPPVESFAHAVERLSLLPLVAGGTFMLFSGLADVGHWYPWRFFFPAAHFWAAWITIGALIIHIGAKSTATAAALHRQPQPDAASAPASRQGLTRRGFLGAVGAAAGLLTLTTLGQTVRPLARVGLLAPRRPDVGPQGLPVNTTARQARVLDAVADPAYRVRVEGRVATPLELSVADLRRLPQHEVVLPISCVEGWSAEALWRGIRVRDLLEMAGAPPDATVEVRSAQPPGRYSQSVLNPMHAGDPDTLLALDVGGRPLHVDHGFPVRLVGPNRPGVLQTKWVSRLVVL